jgi:TonB family protein
MRLRCAAVGFTILWAVAGCAGRNQHASARTPVATLDVYLPSAVVTTPKVIKSSKPAYTTEAMRRRIQGEVVLQVDVRPDGTVGTVALVKSLFPGLDEEAVKTVREFQFAPGEKDGKPVTVRTDVAMAFNLR